MWQLTDVVDYKEPEKAQKLNVKNIRKSKSRMKSTDMKYYNTADLLQ